MLESNKFYIVLGAASSAPSSNPWRSCLLKRYLRATLLHTVLTASTMFELPGDIPQNQEEYEDEDDQTAQESYCHIVAEWK
jgi:hypothetical protein